MEIGYKFYAVSGGCAPHQSSITLVFQLEDTVRLFGTLLLLDPIHFPKSEPCLIIGSVCQIGALLGTNFYV